MMSASRVRPVTIRDRSRGAAVERVLSRRRWTTAALALGVAVTLAACSSSSSSKPSSSPTATQTSGSAAATSGAPSSGTSAAAGSDYYVSLGDSYAAGYQPSGKGTGATNTNGFAYQLVSQAKAAGRSYTLQNFGCAGATTESVLSSPGCQAHGLGPGATPYTGTQLAAAETFLRAHRGKVGLITVSVGGNDITKCGVAANPVTCVSTALTSVTANLTKILAGLRGATGTSTTIVGITYPDVLLGNELSTNAATRQTAELSVVAFKSLINPALKSAYTAAGGKFADVTAATGAYGSLTDMTTLAPYGSIPTPVAKVCSLTYFCQYQDIHPRTAGYALIAKTILGLLPAR
jgi:lysophospholipase L1-like esterase